MDYWQDKAIDFLKDEAHRLEKSNLEKATSLLIAANEIADNLEVELNAELRILNKRIATQIRPSKRHKGRK